MAKKSPNTDDAATLAFSAVEDALKDSVFGDLGPSRYPAAGPLRAGTDLYPVPLHRLRFRHA